MLLKAKPWHIFAVVLLLLLPSAMWASPAHANGDGYITRSDSNGTIWGMRADIQAPSSFNILSGNWGLIRVSVQTQNSPSDPFSENGIEQVGFGQFNDWGLDHCVSDDPGQLKLFWESRHPYDHTNDQTHLNGFYCGVFGNISGGTRTFNVHGFHSTDTCWGQFMNGNNQHWDCLVGNNPSSVPAYFGYIGGEIAKTNVCNGNTAISGNYGKPPSSNIEWQRTADQWGNGTTNWNPVNSITGNVNTNNEWDLNLGEVPSPFIWFDNCVT